MERCSVVFISSTGNTKLLADAIGEALPKENRDYFGEITPEVPESPRRTSICLSKILTAPCRIPMQGIWKD